MKAKILFTVCILFSYFSNDVWALEPIKGEFGEITGDARYRYEHVKQGGIQSDADASTLRIRLGYLTPKFKGFQLFGEYEGNHAIGLDGYNDTRNGKKQFPTVADPVSQDEVNQLWLSYSNWDTMFKIGRQRIKHDEDRWLGNVGWRQMEQTYDAATMENKWIPNTVIRAGYISGVQDFFSRHADISAPYFNVSYDTGTFGKITGYGYFLDYKEKVDAKKSSATIGARISGTYPVSEKWKLPYLLEYAHQSDYGNNPQHYRANYYHVMGGVSAYNVTAKVGYEVLGSDNGVGLSTPLGTKHAFQGWADVFLTTPQNGVEDLYGSVNFAPREDIELGAAYHTFHSNVGNTHYGNEVDLVASYKINKNWSVLAKYAKYWHDETVEKGDFNQDKSIVWGQLSFAF